MATIQLGSNDFTNNAARSRNRIKISIVDGVFDGNVYTEPQYPEDACQIQLDFSCPDNSMYIPVI